MPTASNSFQNSPRSVSFFHCREVMIHRPRSLPPLENWGTDAGASIRLDSARGGPPPRHGRPPGRISAVGAMAPLSRIPGMKSLGLSGTDPEVRFWEVMVGRPAVRLEWPPYFNAYGGAGAPRDRLSPEGAGRGVFETKGKNQKAKISEPCRGPDWGGTFGV